MPSLHTGQDAATPSLRCPFRKPVNAYYDEYDEVLLVAEHLPDGYSPPPGGGRTSLRDDGLVLDDGVLPSTGSGAPSATPAPSPGPTDVPRPFLARRVVRRRLRVRRGTDVPAVLSPFPPVGRETAVDRWSHNSLAQVREDGFTLMYGTDDQMEARLSLTSCRRGEWSCSTLIALQPSVALLFPRQPARQGSRPHSTLS